jgi:hypothetical protein
MSNDTMVDLLNPEERKKYDEYVGFHLEDLPKEAQAQVIAAGNHVRGVVIFVFSLFQKDRPLKK